MKKKIGVNIDVESIHFIAENVIMKLMNAQYAWMASMYLLMPTKNLCVNIVLTVVQNVMIQVSKLFALLVIMGIYQDIMTKTK